MRVRGAHKNLHKMIAITFTHHRKTTVLQLRRPTKKDQRKIRTIPIWMQAAIERD